MSLLLKDLIELIGSEMYHYYQSGSQKPRLFDRVKQKIQALHYSPRTEKTYIGWIKRFISFHGKRHPIEMREKEINSFIFLPSYLMFLSHYIIALLRNFFSITSYY